MFLSKGIEYLTLLQELCIWQLNVLALHRSWNLQLFEVCDACYLCDNKNVIKTIKNGGKEFVNTGVKCVRGIKNVNDVNLYA